MSHTLISTIPYYQTPSQIHSGYVRTRVDKALISVRQWLS